MSEYVIKSYDLTPFQRYECARDEVVRCADCIHRIDTIFGPCCWVNRDEKGRMRHVRKDGFCAWGEKEGD